MPCQIGAYSALPSIKYIRIDANLLSLGPISSIKTIITNMVPVGNVSCLQYGAKQGISIVDGYLKNANDFNWINTGLATIYMVFNSISGTGGFDLSTFYNNISKIIPNAADGYGYLPHSVTSEFGIAGGLDKGKPIILAISYHKALDRTICKVIRTKNVIENITLAYRKVYDLIITSIVIGRIDYNQTVWQGILFEMKIYIDQSHDSAMMDTEMLRLSNKWL